VPNDKHTDAIDELFQVPLNEFTAKRNALVKTLKGADATRVRTLSKPSTVAWAVNQVFWRARRLYEGVMKAGQRLRKIQLAALEGKAGDIRSASDAHRRAVADAAAEAERLTHAAGSRVSRDALMRTFEALSLAAEPPEQPGRLSEALQPAGFEALTGMTPQPIAPKPRADRDRRADTGFKAAERQGVAGATPAAERGLRAVQHPSRDKRAERERRRKEAAEARRRAADEKKHQAEIRKRQAAVERAKASEARARAEWERAQQAVRDAEKQLRDFRLTI
jgi:hypothetical protein